MTESQKYRNMTIEQFNNLRYLHFDISGIRFTDELLDFFIAYDFEKEIPNWQMVSDYPLHKYKALCEVRNEVIHMYEWLEEIFQNEKWVKEMNIYE